jgi:predicted outer membrane repeat protein
MTTKKSYFRKPLALLVLAALAAGVMMVMLASPAWAATYTVDRSDDPDLSTTPTADDCTEAANDCSLRGAINAADTSSGVADTINFDLGSSATITLASQLPDITDSAGLTIDGGSADITISGNDMVRVFQVNIGAKLALENLTVADGKAVSPSPNGAGLAITTGSTVTVTDSTFSGNTVEGTGGQASRGGGIISQGTLTVTNSTFSGNNSSTGSGGGIEISPNSVATVTNSTFSGNSAVQGGGIFADGDTLTVTNTTFSGNSASQGFGAGIEMLRSSATLRNTIVADSTQGNNCFGLIIDGGYNLDDGTTCGFTDATSQSNANPLLGPLQDNGGPTQTHALGTGSPAIDAIPDTNGSTTPGCGDAGITTDQRGVARPQGPACDIGAYEVEVLVDTTPPTVTTTIPEDGALEVSRTTTVKANFSEPVKNVSTETFILERNIAVKKAPPKFVRLDATVTPSDDGLSAELTPVQDLPKGEYRVTITTEVTDLADPANALEEPVVWTFTVAN